MVRTESAATTAATGLLLDVRQEAWPEAAAFEWAVDYTASLVAALEERRSPVRLVAGGEPVTDPLAALVALATVQPSSGGRVPAAALPELATSEVQVVHVITGAGGDRDAARLPGLPAGAFGLVSIVTRRPMKIDAPVGWHVLLRDPNAPVGTARDD